MPVVPSLLGYSASTGGKGAPRPKTAHRAPSSKALRSSDSHSASRLRKSANTMSQEARSALLAPPRAPDPAVYVYAGTSGLRHLFPIHLTGVDGQLNSFSRSISRLRSRVPSTQFGSNIDMVRNICLSLPTLQHLDISENNLNELPVDLCVLVDLRTLNCSHNQLTDVPQSLDKLTHLQELDLSFNQLKTFPSVVYTFTQLIRLNCERNGFRAIGPDFAHLTHLKTVVLDHNQLQNLDLIDFRQLKTLEYIHIAHNQLNQFPHGLQHLSHLRNVDLSSNQLTTFPVELLLVNTLDVLNLSHNFITHLAPLTDAYKRTSLIFSIDLSFNQLSKFYDYLLWISVKLDLSNNQIPSIPKDVVRRLNRDKTASRELKIDHNPLIQPIDILSVDSGHANNLLRILRNCFDEQQNEEIIRQGFKVCITGGKRTGKSALACCLEEPKASPSDKKDEKMLNVLQFAFRVETEQPKPSPPAKKPLRRVPPSPAAPLPPAPPEPIKALPITVYDFNGSLIYYEQLATFLDTSAVHLVCVHAVDFHQSTPADIAEVFHETFDARSHPVLAPLFQILQILCEKVTKDKGILIIPVATCVDLCDKRVNHDRSQVLERIDQFFKLFLQDRLERIRGEIHRISSLPTVSPALSYRLKVYSVFLENTIRIEACQAVSSLTYEGVPQLNQTIHRCLLAQKAIFPHVDRTLPTLWIDANRYIESLADQLPIPLLSWKNFTNVIVEKHGLSNLIDDIAVSLANEGKILIVSQLGTSDRVVFLRPLWLADLLTALFHLDYHSGSNSHSYIKECRQSGRLHSDLLRSLWSNLVHRKEDFQSVWLTVMRFLSFAYPKLNKKQWRVLLDADDKTFAKFDYAIVPYYLPWINPSEQESKTARFDAEMHSVVSVCYRSACLPVGFFHRCTVAAVWKLSVSYLEHWNNFIVGEFDEHSVKFVIETDHQTYMRCHCGTSVNDQPLQQIWNALMLLLNHIEEAFRTLAPNNQFSRSARCPHCREYAFMGEWTTPKELQSLRAKTCPSCAVSIDTSYLVQPNESKRRNEELLRKIRDRKANVTPLITSLV